MPKEKKEPSEKVSIEDLKKKLEECEKKSSEYLAGWQRARADFLNYKKEESERIGKLVEWAYADLILKILTILDNFEIAEKELPDDLKNNKNVKGLLLIKSQIEDFLKKQGVEEVKAIGEKFNPNFHEAIEEIETKDVMSGMVLEEIKKGYIFHGKLLRPAKVKLSKSINQ